MYAPPNTKVPTAMANASLPLTSTVPSRTWLPSVNQPVAKPMMPTKPAPAPMTPA